MRFLGTCQHLTFVPFSERLESKSQAWSVVPQKMLLCGINEPPKRVGYERLVLPDVFQATVFVVIDDFDGGTQQRESTLRCYVPCGLKSRSTKLFEFPWSDLRRFKSTRLPSV